MPSKKTTWNNSYRYSKARTTIQQDSRELSILPNQSFERIKTQQRVSIPASHGLSSNFTQKFDEKHLLRLRLSASFSNGRNRSERLEKSLERANLQNSLQQNYEQEQRGYSLIPTVAFEKRFEKKGRQLTVNVGSKWTSNTAQSVNDAQTDLYNDSGQYEGTDSLMQQQERNNGQQNYSASVLWKEPLSKKDKLHITLKGGIERDQTEQLAYDVEAATRLINTDLSNQFQRYYNYQALVLSWRRRSKVHRLEVTGSIRRSLLRGAAEDTEIRQELYLPTGQVQWRYAFKEGKNLLLSYNLFLVETTLSQLQPFVNNDDPLAIYQGNPDLRPAVNHRLTLFLDLFEQRTFSTFYLNIEGLLTTNTLLQQQQLDSDLRLISQPVNAGLSSDISIDLGYNRFFQVLDLVIDLTIAANRGQRPFLLNGTERQQYDYNYALTFNWKNKKKKVVDWALRMALNGGLLSYADQVQASSGYLNQYYGGHLRLNFLKRWEAQTTLGVNVYGQTAASNNPTVVLWSCSLKRRFLKNERLEVELSAENLLNETLRWQVSQQAFFRMEQRTQQLGRYVLLAVRYKFRR